MDPTVDPLIVAIPSQDGRAAIFILLELHEVSRFLDRSMVLVSGEASNIPRSRNAILDQVRTRYPDRETTWVLWVDSDIVVPRGSTVAIGEALRWAEAHQVGVVANYRMATGQNVVMVHRDPALNHHMTDAEWQALPDYAEVGMSGFGFAYLPQPLHYIFHADTTGEDIHFSHLSLRNVGRRRPASRGPRRTGTDRCDDPLSRTGGLHCRGKRPIPPGNVHRPKSLQLRGG